jgi:hypothetical protein
MRLSFSGRFVYPVSSYAGFDDYSNLKPIWHKPHPILTQKVI